MPNVSWMFRQRCSKAKKSNDAPGRPAPRRSILQKLKPLVKIMTLKAANREEMREVTKVKEEEEAGIRDSEYEMKEEDSKAKRGSGKNFPDPLSSVICLFAYTLPPRPCTLYHDRTDPALCAVN
jgi:hypothetical protein